MFAACTVMVTNRLLDARFSSFRLGVRGVRDKILIRIIITNHVLRDDYHIRNNIIFRILRLGTRFLVHV